MIPLYILAGGKSSRFGSDKARAELHGVPLVARVAEGLATVTAGVTVVAAVEDAYADLGLETIGDDEPGLGPMGGLVTALRHAGGPIFVASCDLREPRAEWAQQVIDIGTTAAFKTARDWEPLFARYEVDVLEAAESLLAGSEGSLHVLLDEVGAVAVEVPGDWPSEASINAPEDLANP